MKTKLINGLNQVQSQYDAFFIDLWGVIHNGVQLYPEAINVLENLTKLNKRFVLMSNAPRPSLSVEKFLINLKMSKAFTKHIFTSGEAALKALNKNIYEPDPRFRGILAISPPGFIDGFIDTNTTSEIELPMLITTGTKDAIPPMMPNWESHTDTYRHAMPGNKYLAVIENADHRFGGLICGETNTSKQYKELKALKAVTLAFFDLVTKNNGKAKNYFCRRWRRIRSNFVCII